MTRTEMRGVVQRLRKVFEHEIACERLKNQGRPIDGPRWTRKLNEMWNAVVPAKPRKRSRKD